ncbi:MAG: ferredoxin [Desulfurivibrio sp.]|nr:ferredoxin [Desulfurivibrio sp.]
MEKSASLCLEITLDSHACNGCGGCAELCPAIFRMNVTGEKAELLVTRTPPDPGLDEAIRLCARQCISVEPC